MPSRCDLCRDHLDNSWRLQALNPVPDVQATFSESAIFACESPRWWAWPGALQRHNECGRPAIRQTIYWNRAESEIHRPHQREVQPEAEASPEEENGWASSDRTDSVRIYFQIHWIRTHILMLRYWLDVSDLLTVYRTLERIDDLVNAWLHLSQLLHLFDQSLVSRKTVPSHLGSLV